MSKITLPVYGIEIKRDIGGGASISSNLIHDDNEPEVNTALSAIESLVLSQACAKMNLTSASYIKSLTEAVENIKRTLS